MIRSLLALSGFFLILCALATDARAQVSANVFTLYPGDVLQITVWKEEGLDQETIVLPDGTINFPLVGTVSTMGLSPAELEATIKTKLKNFIPDASVAVLVKQPLGHTVNVTGQVAKPGQIVMQGRLSVMQALSQAGGLTAYAEEDDIVVLRRQGEVKKSLEYDYDDVADGRAPEKDFELVPGDVIVVPTAGLF